MNRDSIRGKVVARMREALAEGAKFAGAIVAEAGRLNNARMEPAELKRLTRRERRRAVKARLTEHHRSPNRCC